MKNRNTIESIVLWEILNNHNLKALNSTRLEMK